MLDYPKQVSTVLFVGTCNWRCGYCQNIPLLNMCDLDFNKVILPRLIERKEAINHIVISGGEPLYEKNILELVDILKDRNFNIGLHTNGYNYNLLKNIIGKVSFIGMDIKTSSEKYSFITNSNADFSNIEKSVKLIHDSNIEYDIRTTVYPKFVGLEDLIFIAKFLKSYNINEYNIQKYKKINDDEFNYTNNELIYFKDELNKIIKTNLRGLI